MPAIGKAALVVVLLCGAFVTCGQILTSVAGPSTDTASGGADVSAERGAGLFVGKGKCYTCHSLGNQGAAIRGPNLGIAGKDYSEPVALRAATRKKSEGYSAVQYLVESLYDPDAFVVSGFPKGLMPPVHRAPLELGADEVTSVLLFLLAEGNVDADAATAAELGAAQKRFASTTSAVNAREIAIRLPRGDAQAGRALFARMGCVACHKIAGVRFATPVDGKDAKVAIPKGVVAPELTRIGSIQTREYLFESILTPNAVIVADPPGVGWGDDKSYAGKDGWSKMPMFHAVLTMKDILDLVEFLSTLADEATNVVNYGADGTPPGQVPPPNAPRAPSSP